MGSGGQCGQRQRSDVWTKEVRGMRGGADGGGVGQAHHKLHSLVGWCV